MRGFSIVTLSIILVTVSVYTGFARDDLGRRGVVISDFSIGTLKQWNLPSLSVKKTCEVVLEKFRNVNYYLKVLQCETRLATTRISNVLLREYKGGEIVFDNNGFESGTLKPWNPNPQPVKRKYEIVSEKPHSGRYCLKVIQSDPKASYLRQDILGLTPGATYDISCWVRLEDVNRGGAGFVLELYKKNGTWVEGRLARAKRSAAGTSWQKVSYQLTAPHYLGKLRFNITGLHGGGRTFSFYVDDVIIKKIKEAPDFIVHPRQTVISTVEKNKEYALVLQDSSKEGALKNLKVLLRDGGGNTVADLQYNLEKIARNKYTLLLSFPKLKPDAYKLVFSAGDYNPDKPVQLEIVPFSKPVNVSEKGFFLRNGKPFFPIGIYNVGPIKEEILLLKENNFNTIYDDVYTITKRLPAYKKAGFAVVVYCRVKDAEKGGLWRERKGKSHLERVEEVVTRYRQEPDILFWQLEEEPRIKTVETVRLMPSFYRALKKIQPQQPLGITIAGGSLSHVLFKEYFAPMAEVCEVDSYPLPQRPIMDVWKRLSGVEKNLTEPWQVLTAAVQSGYTEDLATQGTSAQTRAMVYLALVQGAKGISYYAFKQGNFYLPNSPLWKEIKKINKEILDLSMPLMVGHDVVGISSDNEQVKYIAKKYDNKIYLITVNPHNKDIQVRFTLPETISIQSALNMADMSAVHFDKNHMYLSFAGIDSKTIIIEDVH